jgi:hypothetical protein
MAAMRWIGRGRCPVCGWVLPGPAWRRAEARVEEGVGLLCYSLGDAGFGVGARLKEPEQLEEVEPGLWAVIKGRFLDALARLVRRRWLSLREVLNSLPLRHLGGGIWVEEYERPGGRPRERIVAEYDFGTGAVTEVSRRPVRVVSAREVKTYVW